MLYTLERKRAQKDTLCDIAVDTIYGTYSHCVYASTDEMKGIDCTLK